MDRRHFLGQSIVAATGAYLLPLGCSSMNSEPLFKISLAEWSLNGTLYGDARKHLGGRGMREALKEDSQAVLKGDITALDFPVVARQEFDIGAVEYVNQFFLDKARDTVFLSELNRRAENEGVTNVLIMCDMEGNLAASDSTERQQAIQNHHQWVDAAAFLGCHSIRVNTRGDGSYGEQQKAAAESLHQLAEYGAQQNISVLVENHGGFSSDATWLTEVMEMADHPGVGTLPDFGNFPDDADKYESVRALMPYAKGVSAKTMGFNPDGTARGIDYHRMLSIVLEAGYHSYVGIESSGSADEYEGIRLTRQLLEQVRKELSG